MPLLDHFHPPLSEVRHWESFHARWASAIADALNRHLPPRYFAESQIHVGSRVEIDVAAFNESWPESESEGGGTATATLPARVWTPPAVSMVMPAVFPDSLEVLIFSSEAGPLLVAAIELASPGNKDRAETRLAFAVKCGSYLQQGINLMIVDIVTSRHANLHNELVNLLEVGNQFLLPPEPLFATAYRPVRRSQLEQIEVWTATMAVGQTLPCLPLALDRGQILPVDLEATYAETCERNRLVFPR